MSTGQPRFPAAALLKGGFLRTQCTEAVRWTCAECGGPRRLDGQACTTCFTATAPLGTCGTCQQRLGRVGAGPRACLSQQAYEADPNRAPIFSRPDQVLWGLKVRPDAPLEVVAETEVRARLASGALSDSVLVSCDFGRSFQAARDLLAVTGRFALDQVWAAIEAVPPPPALRIPTPEELGVTARPVPTGTDRQAEYARRREVCGTAQRAYEAVLVQVRERQRESPFTTIRTQLKTLRDEYLGLTRELNSAIHQMKATRQREEFLEDCRIETADIPGVGAKKKAALSARGIRTAADATSDRIDAVSGFGPELTAAVLAWRRACERRFVFDPAEPDSSEVKMTRKRYAERRLQLEASLVAGPKELRGVVDAQQRIDSELRAAALALRQAEADVAASWIASDRWTRVKLLVRSPATAWVGIAAERTDAGRLYREYILPMAAIPRVAYALGSSQNLTTSGLGLLILSYVGVLVGAYVGAVVIERLARKFKSSGTRLDALKLVAYAATPGWVAGVLNVMPSLVEDLSLLAALYPVYLFYVGLPYMMKTPPDQVVTYMVVAAVVTLMVLGVLAGVAAALVM